MNNLENDYRDQVDNPGKFDSLPNSSMLDVDNVETKNRIIGTISCGRENDTHSMIRSAANGEMELLEFGNVTPKKFETEAISYLRNVPAVKNWCESESEKGEGGILEKDLDNKTNKSNCIEELEVAGVQSVSSRPPQMNFMFDNQRSIKTNVKDPQMEMDKDLSKITCEILSHTGCQDHCPSSPKGRITVKNLPKVKRLTDKFSVLPKFQIREGGKPRCKSKKMCCGDPLCALTFRQRDTELYRCFKPIVTLTRDRRPSCSAGLDSIESPGMSTTAIVTRAQSSMSNGNHFNTLETTSHDQNSNKFSKITFMKTHPVIRLKSSSMESVMPYVENYFSSEHLSFHEEIIPIDCSESIDETCSSKD